MQSEYTQKNSRLQYIFFFFIKCGLCSEHNLHIGYEVLTNEAWGDGGIFLRSVSMFFAIVRISIFPHSHMQRSPQNQRVLAHANTANHYIP